jgi:4-amino-4-deoxychorismate lyase
MSKISNDSEVVQITTIIRYEADLLAIHKSHDSIANKFTSMSDFYLLYFHQDKVMNATKHSNWPAQLIVQVLFAKLLLHINEDRKVDGPLQIHLALAKDGTLAFKASPALIPGALFPIDLSEKKTGPFLPAFGTSYQMGPIQVFINDQVSSKATRFPTFPAPSFANASTVREELITSQYGEVLEGEFTTPYFLREGIWTTPAFSRVVVDSVTRRYALKHRLCKEGIVLRSSLNHGEQCWLSDGVRGFFPGTILLTSSTPKQKESHTPSKDDDAFPQPGIAG